MKKAIVVDWLDKYGGAERVISSLTKTFEFNTCYTLVNIMNKKEQNKVFSKKKINIIKTSLQLFKSNFRYLFFFFPYFVKKIKVDKSIELIFSSSFAVAKGIKKSNPSQIHISYIQARNQRYLWDKEGIYFGKTIKFLLSPILNTLKKIDIKQASKPDYLIANSRFVQKWIKENYKLDSEIIYPPVDVEKFKLQKSKENYFVTACRLEPYKRVDLIVKAFNKSNENLIIIGSGSEEGYLKKIASQNISFIEYSDSSVVYNYISKAKAFIHAGIEDFGIAPVEAQACGTPVIAIKKGGLKETIIENKTGVFFKKQDPDAILDAINRFNKIDFNYEFIRKASLKYSTSIFESKIKEFVKSKTENGKN
ncbi:glycosyltransferase [Flavobacteriaceae bacterium]|nr:glycosyltransferase [Flavobacteriaceae bacterium]MDB9712091.1 glycosyltransferase [Flavobacteriaceae bacterium]MDC1492198.1 glycosyltransferase [Flavobacteriaceae bacterium]